jgi:hypothetical protein
MQSRRLLYSHCQLRPAVCAYILIHYYIKLGGNYLDTSVLELALWYIILLTSTVVFKNMKHEQSL